MTGGKERNIMKYYNTQRPITPGTYPSDYEFEKIVNFDEKIYIKEIDREAWGYLEIGCLLPDDVIKEWELTPENLKTFYCVTIAIYDDGRVTAGITSTVQSIKKPLSKYKNLRRKDIYNDWFATLEEAQAFIKEAKQA